jgi:hypothetical protein
MALLQITASAQSLREGTYAFSLHIPVWNGSGWAFESIGSSLDIKAVADAHLSQVKLRSHSARGSLQNSFNHLEQVRVEIDARDVNGQAINRSGELIYVELCSSAVCSDQQLATFEDAAEIYTLSLRLEMPGEHVVFLATEVGGRIGKATLTIVCAGSYSQSEGGCVISDARYIILGCVFGVLILGLLSLLVYLVRKHRARWKAFLVSFLQHEAIIGWKVIWELWDTAGPSVRYFRAADRARPNRRQRTRSPVHSDHVPVAPLVTRRAHGKSHVLRTQSQYA